MLVYWFAPSRPGQWSPGSRGGTEQPLPWELRAAPAETLQIFIPASKGWFIVLETLGTIQLFQVHFHLEFFSQLLDEGFGQTEETRRAQHCAQLARGTGAQSSHQGLRNKPWSACPSSPFQTLQSLWFCTTAKQFNLSLQQAAKQLPTSPNPV